MKIRPLHDRVVVRRDSVADKSEGGILIPDTVKERERPSKGVVVAVGPGLRDKDGKRMTLDVKKGDVVLFGRYSGSEVSGLGDDAKDLISLREEEIIGVVE